MFQWLKRLFRKETRIRIATRELTTNEIEWLRNYMKEGTDE